MRRVEVGGYGMAGLLRACTVALLLAIGTLVASGRAEAGYASIVIDARTGEVLLQQNADNHNYPASLTKMMTLYMLFDALKQKRVSYSTQFKVSHRGAGQPPSRLGLAAGDTITVRDAVFALITKSANDVATTVGENLADSEYRFALAMTEKARALGMKDTTFRNASGLPNRHQVSTARDMARLAVALQRDFPDEYRYFATESFRYNGRTFSSHNNLLGRYEGADGIKTGYIRASGFNLVASAQRGNRRLIGVVFGGKSPRSRDLHMMRLLDRGFAKLGTTLVAKAPAGKTPPVPEPRPGLVVADADQLAQGDASEEVAAKADARRGGWGIQVGAFAAEAQAQSAIDQALDLMPELQEAAEPVVERKQIEHGVIFRSRLMGFDETAAREACGHLKRKKMVCIPVRDVATPAAAQLRRG